MNMTIGGVPLTKTNVEAGRLTMLLFGPVGSGKTPLAMTAPAPILYILFDIDGDKTVAHVNDRFDKLDLTAADHSVVDQLWKLDSKMIRDIDAALATGQYKTIILDSITQYADLALQRGVMAMAAKKSTLLDPGMTGYGARLTLMVSTMNTLHQVCSKHNVNLVVVGHDRMHYDKDGNPTVATPALPGQTVTQIPKNISEIWCLRDIGTARNIYLRPFARYEGMRSRMFNTEGTNGFFQWKFDANKWEGTGQIEKWLDQWRKNGGHKIAMPK